MEDLHRAQFAVLAYGLEGRGEHGGADFSAGMFPRLTCLCPPPTALLRSLVQ